MSTQPIDFSSVGGKPVGAPIDFSSIGGKSVAASAQPSTPAPTLSNVLTRSTDDSDKDYTSLRGPAGVAAATIHGFNEVARGTQSALKGTWDTLATPPKDAAEHAAFLLMPGAGLPLYRALRGLGHTAADATQLLGAIHDINASPDPTTHYAQAAEDTASQGAGQALTALGTEGAVRGIAKLPGVVSDVASSPTTAKVIQSGKVVGASAEELPGVGGIVKGAKKLGQLRDIWSGPKAEAPPAATGYERYAPNTGAEASTVPASESAETGAYQEPTPTPGEEPAQPLPKVKAKTVKQSKSLGPDAQTRTQAQSLAPRTVVLDPQTGAPEFSDVVAAKQQAAAPPAAVQQSPVQSAVQQPAAATPPPAAAAPAAAAPATTDPLLARLQRYAANIQEQPEVPSAENQDYTDILQRSVAQVEGKKGAVFTTAAPKDLLDRWGVDPKSFTEGRAQTRGMSPQDSAASIKQLTEAYKNGQPVEPLLETRDAQNNIIDVDGRGRALAAHRAGVERVPVIVRRLPAPQPVQ